MRAALRRIVRSTAPQAYWALSKRRSRARFRAAHGGAEFRATRALTETYGKRVAGGPFRQMVYGDDVVCSAYVAKLVGSYEEELQATVEAAISRAYTRVIDIGCAEGYYAVGFAYRLPSCEVYAFDTSERAQHCCRELAELNGVSARVHVSGTCGDDDLRRLTGERTLVICDCEGAEWDVLDPNRVEQLLRSDLIVELHEHIRPGVTSLILKSFSRSHEIELISTRDRDPTDYPVLDVVAKEDRAWAVREGRPVAMQWAVMRSKSS